MFIEDIAIGTLVWTVSETTGQRELKPITQTHRRTTLSMMVVELENGTIFEVTPEHRFFVQGEWKEIQTIKQRDKLELVDGEETLVKNIGFISKSAIVYNFDVLDNENYFVTEDGVLVHNGYASANELKKLDDRGYTGVRSSPRGGLDYSNSNALYPVKEGQRNIVKIEYTGVYGDDFEKASQAALGQKSTPKGYIWHHLDDYNPSTNTGTMQLVKQDAHTGISHIGGCSQYKEATGNPYIFRTW